MNIAVILAGGSGSRLGGGVPKQFMKVAGKKIIEHTIDVFESHDLIDEIAIVSRPDYIPDVEEIVRANRYQKVKKVLPGGKERYDSSLSAINAYPNDHDNLLFHDAVRPLVNHRIINDCIKALQTYNAVDVATRTTDTIIQVDQNDCIVGIPPRKYLRNGQTPQCFKRGVIRRAYDIALKDPAFVTTDDCGVVRRYLPGEPVYIVEGEMFNMKVTYAEDLFLLDKLYQLKSIAGSKEVLIRTIREMSGKVMVVFGGSEGIGGSMVSLGRELGAVVYSMSRQENGVDIADMEKVGECLREVHEREGHIDYVVCTPGELLREPLSAMSYSAISDSVNTNYLGAVVVAKESYEYLRESCGSLLFFTSGIYTRGRMLYSIYSSTKAAIVNLVQALSEEWADSNVRVNCMCPDATKTPMRLRNFGIEREGSLLASREVAVAAVNTLVSPNNGQVINVKK